MSSILISRNERVWELHCDGYSPTQIAERLDMQPGEVRRIVCKYWEQDWTPNTLKNRGEQEWKFSRIG